MNTGRTVAMIKNYMHARTIRINQKTVRNVVKHNVISLIALALSVTSTFANDIKKDSILAGKNIYIHGKLSSGEDVIATTVGDVQLTGEQAACVNCHRHSGLGSIEGSTIAPPITGEILFLKKNQSTSISANLETNIIYT